MSEVRRDIVTDTWVIVETERDETPRDHLKTVRKPPVCPFCTGNESMTPPEVTAVRPDGSGPNKPGWQVRILTKNAAVTSPKYSVLHENGITILQRENDLDSSSMILNIRPMELVLEYGDVSRPWIIGSKRVVRIAKCELSSTLYDADGSVLMTLRTSGIEEDMIPWSDAEVLNGSEEWDWLSGDMPENRGGGILEPIIVSGVVASLVYLFYSSRAE